jgi:hypothetical protein
MATQEGRPIMRSLRRALAALIAACSLVALGQLPSAAADDVEVTVTPSRPGAQYLYGQSIVLTATTNPATDLDHWHWFIKEPGDADFEVSHFGEAAELRLPHSMTWDGAQVYAELYGDDHSVAGRSDTLTLDVERLPATTELSASADRAAYRVGDTAALTSTQNPPTADDHYHWYLRRPGEEYFTWIDGTSEADATLDVTADHNGAEVIARLFNHDHVILAESEPIRLVVDKARSRVSVRVPNAPLTARERPRLAIRIAAPVAPTGSVKVRVDGRLRATESAGERTTVVLARLSPGRHRLKVAYTGDRNLERDVVSRTVRVSGR